MNGRPMRATQVLRRSAVANRWTAGNGFSISPPTSANENEDNNSGSAGDQSSDAPDIESSQSSFAVDIAEQRCLETVRTNKKRTASDRKRKTVKENSQRKRSKRPLFWLKPLNADNNIPESPPLPTPLTATPTSQAVSEIDSSPLKKCDPKELNITPASSPARPPVGGESNLSKRSNNSTLTSKMERNIKKLTKWSRKTSADDDNSLAKQTLRVLSALKQTRVESQITRADRLRGESSRDDIDSKTLRVRLIAVQTRYGFCFAEALVTNENSDEFEMNARVIFVFNADVVQLKLSAGCLVELCPPWKAIRVGKFCVLFNVCGAEIVEFADQKLDETLTADFESDLLQFEQLISLSNHLDSNHK